MNRKCRQSYPPGEYYESCSEYTPERFREELAHYFGIPVSDIPENRVRDVICGGWCVNKEGVPYCTNCGAPFFGTLAEMLEKKPDRCSSCWRGVSPRWSQKPDKRPE